MIKILFILILASCASPKKTKTAFPPEADVVTKDFSSSKEARNFVRNKLNYITLLFEQSHDPYYGTPKWPADCLKKNNFSKLMETDGNLYFNSQLYLNEKMEAGFCDGNLKNVIFLQCKDESRVHEIRCSPGACQDVLNGNPCPLIK